MSRKRRKPRGKFQTPNPYAPKGLAPSREIYYYKDANLSMSQELAKRVWVCRSKQRMGGSDFFYSIVAQSFVAVPAMATMYWSEQEAFDAMAKLEVGVSAKLEVLNLFTYLSERLDAQPDVVSEEESFGELGLEDPGIEEDKGDGGIILP